MVFSECKTLRSRTTTPLTIENIAAYCDTTKSAGRKAIQRLEEKGLLLRTCFKAGPGGWTQYELPDHMYKEILAKETTLNLSQTWAKPESKLEPNIPTSSNSIINKTTTALPEDWQKIEFESLTGIGFTTSRLLDIYETKTNTAEVVQQSINHFAYMLEHRPEKVATYKDPLTVLIGTLRKGKDWFEKDYKSPQELAMQRMVEQKKRELERKEKLEKELFDLHYQEWESSLDEEAKNTLLSESARRSNLSGMKTAELIKHFKQTVWPEISTKAM